jgi:gas vesicle protein
MKSFLAGLGIGLGVGLLFAPMSGEETRSNIRQRANDLADQAKGVVDEGRSRINRGIQSIRGEREERVTGTETSI